MPLVGALLLIVFSFSAMAQVTKVRGTVTDASTGEPIPFVNVYFKGTTIGTSTDLDGTYSIETRYASDSVAASSVGFITGVKQVQKNRFQQIDF